MALANGSGAAETDTPSNEEHGATAKGAQPTKRKTTKPPKRQLTQSTIGFPYRDLEQGIGVAQAIMQAGGVALSGEQLAGVMGLQSGSGNFVMKLATARIFGLIANVGGKYELTNLGFAILDTDERRQKKARAD